MLDYLSIYGAKRQFEISDQDAPQQLARSRRWRTYRRAFLARPENVWCRYEKRKGVFVKATVVNHWFPHQGNRRIFWETAWHVPLSRKAHAGWKKHIEDIGLRELLRLAPLYIEDFDLYHARSILIDEERA